MNFFKRLAALLPDVLQFELKRMYFGQQIVRNTFETLEPEYKILSQIISDGNWVIDIGANIGHYTKRFSDIVGERGRVIALEPVPTTFALLSANAKLFKYNNVTLINAAASKRFKTIGMNIPKFSTGLKNYYRAQCSFNGNCDLSVLTIPVDSLNFSERIALIKIDVEGYEMNVLDGLKNTIKTNKPILIIETCDSEITKKLSLLGYIPERLHKSPNILFRPKRI